ncbi:chloride channel protein [Halarsenatibacter silvermanii]|uniref:Chloride channel protein, CIC family n=1 Tax=Halarsenatibacter silvermanii TaxID=321763 RepID=A0A1G9P8M5_9FIRM|nr:chloride channel protein [Halarsenatibacter silvermanii]SDL94841.1 chloride channel protein, CIC family [Halarsenatibacter silvermanii]
MAAGDGQENDFFSFITDFKGRLKNLESMFRTPYMPKIMVLAALVGVVGGLGAVVFYNLILLFKYIFYGASDTAVYLDHVRALPWYYRLVAPALGGLIVGPMVTYIVPEAKGHGVPEVMEALVLKAGEIRFIVAPLKALISAICIGSGGSAGREGPIVQIGASFGSSLGEYFNLPPDKVKTLLGSGAAAGIAGTFNAPLAGVVFSMEVILRKFEMEDFSPLVVSAVIGTAVANILFGEADPVFQIPEHELVNYFELILYMGLGIAGGITALIYGNFLYKMEHIFEKLPIPTASKAALGGLCLGILALALPQVQATGYPVMEDALYGRLPIYTALLLMLAKILATWFTLGSGGSGGIFAPALFIGAMLGSSYGHIVGTIFPTLTAGSGSYAMVGLGTVFAGATHAPLTAIIILFEMTHDPLIILPMMFACKFSSLFTRWWQRRNIYTTKLVLRGIDLDTIEGRNVLSEIPAAEVMSTDLITVRKDTTMEEARDIFRNTLYNFLPVICDDKRHLCGLLGYNYTMDYFAEGGDMDSEVSELAYDSPPTVNENETLLRALKLIDEYGITLIPVVSEEDENKLIGILTRSDILEAYHHWEIK